MMQNQFGEPVAPASPVQTGQEVNAEVAMEDEQLNRSIKKLQQVCQETVTTAVVVASIVQSEAAQWIVKLEALSKQWVGRTEIISQTSSQIKEWFAQVNQVVERMKGRLQSMEADLVTFAGTDLIKVEDLLEAIAKVRKIATQIDYCQAEVEVEQTAITVERAEMATTNHRLQVAVDQLKQTYLEQMSTAVEVTKIAQEEATKWVVQVKKILARAEEEPEVVSRMQMQVQEWLTQVDRVWVVKSTLEQSYTTADMVIVAKVTQETVQDTMEAIMKAKKIFAQIETYQAEITAMKAARVAGQAEKIAHERETAAILARIIDVKATVVGEKEKAAKAARKEADIKTEAATKAKAAVERGKFKEKAVEKAVAAEKARRAAKAKVIGVYVLIRDDGNAIGNIIVINNETNKIMSTIPVGQHPCSVAVTPDGSKIYVANGGGSNSNNIVVIDTVTQQVKDTIPVGKCPCGVAVTPDGSKIYVANGGSDSNSIIVIDTATQQVKNTIPVKQCPCGVAITPDGTQAYVWTREQTDYVRKDRGDMPFILQRRYDDIIVIDIATQQVISTIPVGKLPEDVAITLDGRRAYVANGGSDNVSVIDTVTQKVLATILVGRNPNGVAITLDGRRAYVANGGSNNVSVIDTATQRVLATIPVRSYPNDIAVTPDGKKGYVANRDSNTVSVIDTATQQVLATIPVGSSPRGIAIASIIPQ
jgi:YVTN family beta-propeller protein